MAVSHLTDKSFESLAKALRCYLDFQIHCGREALLSEAYLTQPIGEFLLGQYSGHFKREVDHPQFKNAKKGRSRQIDFVLESRDAHFLDFAIECKWAGSHPPDRQSVIDDVMRLECLRRPDGQAGTSLRFFVLAGRSKSMGTFLNGRFNDTGLPTPPSFVGGYLPRTVGTKLQKIDVHNCEEYYRKLFQIFATGYKTEIPKSYRARMIADEEGDLVRVLIWKIGSSSKRRTFDPKSTW